MPPTLYAAVKLTIKNKRSLPKERSLEEVLDSASSLVNSYFQPFLAAKFMVEGSEIKGILNVQETPRILQLIELVDLEMDPIRFYYALGVGNIKSRLDGEKIEEEGPAWTGVNRALKEMVSSGGGRDIIVKLPSPFLTRTVNTLFSIESDLRNNWSIAHRDAIKLARHGRTQVEMAELLGVTQAAVSQRLKHARWDRYQQICETIYELLMQARWKMLLPWDLKNAQQGKLSQIRK
ncbi:MAG TPA: hypothetical protein DDW93_11425 [Firmicutes bacterium]|jgi:hypothetical protein|nr:hypothetical protein [Bacillota bacterium]HBK67162.1 hypothetical protein [Bacillota bacterium]HBT16004.1 hypothetical protein [Bacillota bacterium]